MKMENKIFLMLLAVASVMVIGVITQNTRSVIRPQKAEVTVNTDHVRRDIEKAGLIPHDAMHWKEL